MQISQHLVQGAFPAFVAEAIYMRTVCTSTGVFLPFIPHNPHPTFCDFEHAAKSGHHATWFKLGCEYENFGNMQHT